MVTEQGCGLGIGGCKRLCRRGRGVWLGYTAFPVCVGYGLVIAQAIEASHRSIVPSTYLGMGA